MEGTSGHPSNAVPESYVIGVATHIYRPPSRWRILRWGKRAGSKEQSILQPEGRAQARVNLLDRCKREAADYMRYLLAPDGRKIGRVDGGGKPKT